MVVLPDFDILLTSIQWQITTSFFFAATAHRDQVTPQLGSNAVAHFS
jgi:hypothetical protein